MPDEFPHAAERGSRRHRRRGENACRPCLDAHATYTRQWVKSPPATRTLKPCGTDAAYKRHLHWNEYPCRPCRRAHTRAVQGPNWKPRQAKPCGTLAAYQRHLYWGETACRPCCEAKAAASRRGRKSRAKVAA